MNSELQEWINKAKKAGMKDEHIHKQLRAQGWSDADFALNIQQKQGNPKRSENIHLLISGIIGVLFILLPTVVYYILVVTLDWEGGGESVLPQVLLITIMPFIVIVGLIISVIVSIYSMIKKQIIIGASFFIASVALALLFRYVMQATAGYL